LAILLPARLTAEGGEYNLQAVRFGCTRIIGGPNVARAKVARSDVSSAPMIPSQFDVAVVGAGIPGLSAALGCAQLGFRVALFGASPRTYASSSSSLDARIYTLAPASVALLQRLGAWSGVDSLRTCPVERMRVFGDAGDELVFEAYSAAVERLATVVEERQLLRALDSACGFQPAIRRIASPFAATTVQADAIRIDCENGTSLSAHLLIGADGADSSVRAAAGIGEAVKSYEQAAVVANFSCARPHLNTAWQWFTEDGVVALLPLPGDFVSLVWSAPRDLAAQLMSLDAGALAARVTLRCETVLGELKPEGLASTFDLKRMSAARLIGPRVALVGDAAHVIHPLAGQGLNLGLQDVAMLLDVLGARESFRNIGDATLLRRYERGRAEPIGLMRFTTDSLATLFGMDDPLARRLRNAGLTAVNRIKPLKNALIRQALG